MRIVLHFLITKQDLFQIRNRVQLLLAVICGFLPIETELSGGQDRISIIHAGFGTGYRGRTHVGEKLA